MYNINISSHTDIGDVKRTNQDSILSIKGMINGHYVGLFIVADGCGGLKFGEEVSNLIVARLSRVWNDEFPKIIGACEVNLTRISNYFNDLLDDINNEALAFGSQVSSKVGSTVSLLFTVDKNYIIKNVGDSRVYLKRGRKIIRLTEDQSLVADLVRNGELTKEQAKNFKKKNVLTMCVGFYNHLKVYTKMGSIKNGDIFVVCCDGLHNLVSEEKMAEILADKSICFEKKAEALRQCIEYGKATDNVSLIVCRYELRKGFLTRRE